MAVRLDINVRGVKGLGGRGGGGSSPAAMQRQMAQLQKIQERSEVHLQKMREQFQRRNELSQQQAARRQEERRKAALEREANRRKAHERKIAIATERWRKRMLGERMKGERAYQRLKEKEERAAHRKAMARIAQRRRAMRRAAAALGRSMRSVGGGIAGAGSGIGGALGALTSGGGGLGGLVRGVGGAGASLVGGAGALGGGIAGAIPGIGGMAEGIVKGISSAGAGVVQAAGNLAGMFVDKFVGIAKVGLIAGLGVAFASVAKAAQFENIQTGFKGLVRTWGVDAPEALERMRTAAKGTVSDLDLMANANQALLLRAAQTLPQFELMIEAGRRLGKAMGRTATEGLNDLAVGMGRQSRMILDNLGLVIKLVPAYEAYAQQVGKSVTELSEMDKRQAFLTATTTALQQKMKELGPEVRSFTDDWNAFKAEVENLAVEIGMALMPALKEMLPPLRDIAKGIGEWLSENRVVLVEKFKDAVAGVQEVVTNLASALSEDGLSKVWERGKAAARDFFEFVRLQFAILMEGLRGELDKFMATAKGESVATGAGWLDAVSAVGGVVTGAPTPSLRRTVKATTQGQVGAIEERTRINQMLLREQAGQTQFGGGGGATSPQPGLRGAAGGAGVQGIPGLPPSMIGLMVAAVEVEGGLKSLKKGLLDIGVEFDALPPTIQAMVESVAKAGDEQTTAAIDNIGTMVREEKVRKAMLPLVEAETDSKKRLTAAARQWKDAIREHAALTRQRLEVEAKIAKLESETPERLREFNDSVSEATRTFAESTQEIAERLQASLAAIKRSAVSGVRGSGVLPGRFERGIARGEAEDRMRVKNAVRGRFGHLSSSDLKDPRIAGRVMAFARSQMDTVGGARERRMGMGVMDAARAGEAPGVMRDVEAETGKASEAMAEASKVLAEKLEAAEKTRDELLEATTEMHKTLGENMDQAAETITKTADKVKDISAEVEKNTAALKKVQDTIAAIN